MMSFNPSSRAHYRSRLARRSLIAVGLLLVAPLVWAAPYAYIPNHSSNTVSVIDTATNTVTATVGVGGYPYGVAVSPDGLRVYVTNNNYNAPYTPPGPGSVSVIDAATNTVTATVPVGSTPFGVAVSPDGSRVYVANGGSNTVSVIDTATNTVTATVYVGSTPFGVAVSPDGSRVYVTSNTVSVIDAATNTVTATVPVGSTPLGVAVSPNGSRVYVANDNSNTVSVIDAATNTVTATVPVGPLPFGVAVSPDGSQVYVTNDNNNNGSGSVSVIDTATDTVTATLPMGNFPAGVAVSPDGSRLYVANNLSNAVWVFNTATNTGTTTVGAGNPYSFGAFVGPGALLAANSSTSGGAGSQISGTVPALNNSTYCPTTDTQVQSAIHGNVMLDSASGAFTYTPTSTTYSGPDAFTWRAEASPGCSIALSPTYPISNTATVSLTIDPLLTGLGDVTLGEGKSTSEAFSLTGSTPFTHTLASDNATVLPPADLTVSPAACGSAGNLSCTLDLTAASAPGTASVSVTATDKYGDAVAKTLLVTVIVQSSSTGGAGSSSSGGGGGAFGAWELTLLAALALLVALGRKTVLVRSSNSVTKLDKQ